MNHRRPCRNVPFESGFFTPVSTIVKQAAVVAVLFATLPCLAQDQSQTSTNPDQASNPGQSASNRGTVTIPAGTRVALVLTHPIQSRHVRRGDDVFAQVSFPVNSGNEVVIPPGTFVNGIIDKLENDHGRRELRLQSMSATFPDGYVVAFPGPVTLQSDDGWAVQDPGPKRMVAAFALPAAGAGIGALIGHSLGHSQSQTLGGLPPNCGVPTPGCMNGTPGTTLTDNSGRLKSTAIGSMAGLAIGGVGSLALLFNSHNYYLYEGSPVEVTLDQPITLQRDEVHDAVQESLQYPVPDVPAPPRPVILQNPPSSNAPVDHGTCWTPGTPGTPPTVIPGVPDPNGIPGPPTIIPGTPPTPGTPYPCP